MAVSKHTLDEESEYFLDLINATAGTKPPSELSVEEARYHDDATSRLFGGEIVFDGDINDIKTEHNIAGKSVCIIVRVYKPTICQDDPPILIYFHGGGFVMGQLHSVETTCKKIACLSKCIVVSVDYRLAPEYKYPTCFYDGICTTKWVIGNKTTIGGNEQSIVGVCGSSAGGTIAAVVAIEVPSVSFQ
ncbi:esterase LipI-like, partial [Saccoglossus kowalevskii]|uniref:AB hydrolase superfamily protein C1039.03-like n=1 Tax=Saccoglossus kowalevskii TaxID=10224 RepID=A0ABM0GZU7_SACKO